MPGDYVNSIMRLVFVIGMLMSAACVYAQQPAEEIRKSIYFGGGSYEISEDQIAELVHWLDSIPNLVEKYDIQLISHTDPIGGRQYNEWLSQQRGAAVQNVILQKNIPPHKISLKSWGLDNPVYNNSTWRGMQMNRRVDVILYPVIF